MKIAFDHETGKTREEASGFPSAPDWEVLRSRLFAAHEVRTVLTDQAASARLRTRGSFAGGAATLLNGYDSGSRPVNLDVSSNIKPGGVKVTTVAGIEEAGGRG